jgi:hypothetical protein
MPMMNDEWGWASDLREADIDRFWIPLGRLTIQN